MTKRTKRPTSLEEFAAADETKPGNRSYMDTLPDDIKAQIRGSHLGHSQVVRWLHAEGYERVTQQMVTGWRAKPGNRPSGQVAA